jgi:hypothetical protein
MAASCVKKPMPRKRFTLLNEDGLRCAINLLHCVRRRHDHGAQQIGNSSPQNFLNASRARF